VLIEYIFAYPGIGNLASAPSFSAAALIQGLILTFAVLFIVTNLAVDMAYGTQSETRQA
jgi:peptide/nickel transport system permease protein